MAASEDHTAKVTFRRASEDPTALKEPGEDASSEPSPGGGSSRRHGKKKLAAASDRRPVHVGARRGQHVDLPAPWGSPAVLGRWGGCPGAGDGRRPRPRRGRGTSRGRAGRRAFWRRQFRRACPTTFTAEAGRAARDDVPITVLDGERSRRRDGPRSEATPPDLVELAAAEPSSSSSTSGKDLIGGVVTGGSSSTLDLGRT